VIFANLAGDVALPLVDPRPRVTSRALCERCGRFPARRRALLAVPRTRRSGASVSHQDPLGIGDVLRLRLRLRSRAIRWGIPARHGPDSGATCSCE
jgi:hypothetical protein